MKPGYGYYERALPLISNARCVYAAYVVEVYEVASTKTKALAPFPCRLKREGPLEYKPGFEKYTTDEKERIKSLLEAWMSESLAGTFQRLSLIPRDSVQ